MDFCTEDPGRLLAQRQYSQLLLRVALAVVTVDRCALQAQGGALVLMCHHGPTKRHRYPPGADWQLLGVSFQGRHGPAQLHVGRGSGVAGSGEVAGRGGETGSGP